MAARRQRISPLNAALARLADLAGRGVQPARMAREVDVIVAGWLGNADPEDPDAVRERLTGLHEQLMAGTADAAEQLADVDRSEAAAARHAALVHAALVAACDAVARSLASSLEAPSAAA
jgi:hypothetical protein